MTEFGTCHCADAPPPEFVTPAGGAPSWTCGCDRTTTLMRTATFGKIYGASPRIVVENGSTLRQPGGSGPASALLTVLTWLYFVAVAQVSTTERPIPVPNDATIPPRSRELRVKSMPSQ